MQRDDLSVAVRDRLQPLPPPLQAHHAVVPLPPPQGDVPLDAVADRVSAADAALARVEAIGAEFSNPYRISRVLLRREAVRSSSIDGIGSTLDEILSLEETGDEPAGPKAQVWDYAVALADLVPRARDEQRAIFTTAFVKGLHRTIMRGGNAQQDTPGELRSQVIWVGGNQNIAHSTYNPAPPEHIGACLDETMRYLRGEGMQSANQSLIVRMAIAHCHFEAVHPFGVGNGRVGRMLWPLMMAADGRTPLFLSSYIKSNEQAHEAALDAAWKRLEWHEAVGFLADAIAATANELLATHEALADLRALWRLRRQFRQGSAALRALHVLPHYPVLTVKRLAAVLEVSFPSATQAMAYLVDAGILSERTGYSRNRVFACPEALAIIVRPFGEPPLLPS